MSPKVGAPAFEVALNGSTLPPDVAGLILSIEVDSEPDTLDYFSLTVLNVYPQLRFTHGGDTSTFQEGNAVKIKLGYVDALEPVFDGEITSVTPVFPDGSAPTLLVEGHTRLHRLQGSRQ